MAGLNQLTKFQPKRCTNSYCVKFEMSMMVIMAAWLLAMVSIYYTNIV